MTMRVPEELAHGLSDLLVVYLIARTLPLPAGGAAVLIAERGVTAG